MFSLSHWSLFSSLLCFFFFLHSNLKMLVCHVVQSLIFNCSQHTPFVISFNFMALTYSIILPMTIIHCHFLLNSRPTYKFYVVYIYLCQTLSHPLLLPFSHVAHSMHLAISWLPSNKSIIRSLLSSLFWDTIICHFSFSIAFLEVSPLLPSLLDSLFSTK